MKPIISESVYKKICNLLRHVKNPQGQQLSRELSKAEIVKDIELKGDVVTINSVVEYQEKSLNKPISIKIVMPEEADLAQRKVSIFAPISIALIGFKESYSFDWILPSGHKKFKIIKVTNQ